MRKRCEAIVLSKDLKHVYIGFDKDGWPEMPGGGKEEGETVFEAAKREVMEEIGVRITKPTVKFKPVAIITPEWSSIVYSFVCSIKRKDDMLHGDGPEGKLTCKRLSIEKAIEEFERRINEYPKLNHYGEALSTHHIHILSMLRDLK